MCGGVPQGSAGLMGVGGRGLLGPTARGPKEGKAIGRKGGGSRKLEDSRPMPRTRAQSKAA